MSGSKAKKLSKAFNRNVGGIIGGLIALKNQPGSKLSFDVVTGRGPLTNDRVLISTNIPLSEAPGQKLAILIDPYTGIKPYGYFSAGNDGLQIGTSSFKQSFHGGEKDATTVKEVLEAVMKRAVTKGLVPEL